LNILANEKILEKLVIVMRISSIASANRSMKNKFSKMY